MKERPRWSEKRGPWSAAAGVFGAFFGGGAIAWYVVAAPKGSHLARWPALPLLLLGAAGFYCMIAALKAWWPFRNIDENVNPPVETPPPPPVDLKALRLDLRAAASARVTAVNTVGPARNKRLQQSGANLQRAIDALEEGGFAGEVLKVAQELVGCTDSGRAAVLRDQVFRQLAPSDDPSAIVAHDRV